MRTTWFCAVLILVFCTSLPAGDVFHPDSNAAAGSLNGLPWAQTEIRYQALVPAKVFGGKTIRITDLAFATGAAGTFTATQCEITLAHLPTSSRFSTTFATNLQKDKTVMFSGPISWPCLLDQWCSLGLNGTFNYNGVDNVVVEVRFQNGLGGVRGDDLVLAAVGADVYGRGPAVGQRPAIDVPEPGAGDRQPRGHGPPDDDLRPVGADRPGVPVGDGQVRHPQDAVVRRRQEAASRRR